MWMIHGGCGGVGGAGSGESEEGGHSSSGLPGEVSFSLARSGAAGGTVTAWGITVHFEVESAYLKFAFGSYDSDGKAGMRLEGEDSYVTATTDNSWVPTVALYFTDEGGDAQDCTGTFDGTSGYYELTCGVTVVLPDNNNDSVYAGEITYGGFYDFSTGVLNFSVEGEYQGIDLSLDVDFEGDVSIPSA